MKLWQRIVGVIAFGAIGICIGCTRSLDYTDGEDVLYSEFPKEVQDTLIWWGEHTVISIGDTIYIPSDYNVVSMGVDSNSVFKRQILR